MTKKEKTDKAKVLALLRALGKTKDEVAKKLVRLRCKGDQCSNDDCPVAVYLLKRGVVSPSVWCDKVFFDGDDDFVSNNTDSVDPPRAIRRFCDAFDNGKYPKLIKAPERGQDEERKGV
jgi:hypothetical protein